MRGSWRLAWALGELTDAPAYRKHARVLHQPWKYWIAICAKLVPHLWPFAVHLRLRDGGSIAVVDFMTLYIYKEVFVDGCYDPPLASSPKATVIDIGANTGLFALRAKQLHPHAAIWCYEPSPVNYAQLNANLARSRFEDCSASRKGVGGKARTERLYLHKGNIGGHSIDATLADTTTYVDIELVDLESVLAALGGRACDLLKIDCEGAEYEIIMSIDSVLADRIDRIVFESTPSRYDLGALLGHLEALGYRVERHKGLHVAFRDTAGTRRPA